MPRAPCVDPPFDLLNNSAELPTKTHGDQESRFVPFIPLATNALEMTQEPVPPDVHRVDGAANLDKFQLIHSIGGSIRSATI